MVRFALLLLAGIACQLAPAFGQSYSGAFYAAQNAQAFFLQLIDSGQGQLTGRYEEVSVGASGKLQSVNASVKGTADQRGIVLELRLIGATTVALILSGSLKGEQLALSGGGNGQSISLVLLKTADEREFRDRAQRIAADVERNERFKKLNEALAKSATLRRSLDEFSSKMAAELPKFEPFERKLKSTTSNMQAALARQRSIYRSDTTAVVRGQIEVAINQANVESSQLHVSLQSANREFEAKRGEAIASAKAFFSLYCAAAKQAHDEHTDFPKLEDWLVACRSLLESAAAFQEKSKALTEAFASAERVWREESSKQNAIIQASEIASR